MQLRVTGKHLDTRPLHGVLTQGEKNVNNPTITMPRNYDGVDISGLDYEMQAYSTKDTLVMHPLTKQVTDIEIALTWKITEEFTAVAGPIWFVIVGTDANNEQIIIITADEVVVRQAPQGRWQPPPPDLLASTLAQMITIKATAMQYATDAAAAAKQSENAAARAEAASAAMPYVGDDGYWYTWDNNTGQFVKTNIPKKHSHPMSEVSSLESTIAQKANTSNAVLTGTATLNDKEIPTTESGYCDLGLLGDNNSGAWVKTESNSCRYVINGNTVYVYGRIAGTLTGVMGGYIKVIGLPVPMAGWKVGTSMTVVGNNAAAEVVSFIKASSWGNRLMLYKNSGAIVEQSDLNGQIVIEFNLIYEGVI